MSRSSFIVMTCAAFCALVSAPLSAQTVGAHGVNRLTQKLVPWRT